MKITLSARCENVRCFRKELHKNPKVGGWYPKIMLGRYIREVAMDTWTNVACPVMHSYAQFVMRWGSRFDFSCEKLRLLDFMMED